MSEVSPLASHLRSSAESFGLRGGHLVPLRYGSAAGELAACMRSVGLVDREDLRVLRISADAPTIDRLTAELFDRPLACGEVASAGSAHWCMMGPGDALAVLPAPSASALCEALLRIPGGGEASVEETGLQAIGVIGRATAGLLADLGMHRALARVNGRGQVAGAAATGAVTWMVFDESSALALVDPADAVGLWRVLSELGRRFGLTYVGAEAAERFEAVRCRAGEIAGR
jgi:hypothetical protein